MPSFPDFGLTEGMLTLVRIIAAVGGALVGWFLCDLITRMLYRLTFRAATPGWLLMWTKLIGSVSLALLIYFFMPLGGGGGGLGWGPGLGGGPGKGAGQGGKDATTEKKDSKSVVETKKDPDKDGKQRQAVEIEILGGARLNDGKNRYYLLDKKEPPLSLSEVEEYFKKHRSRIQVKIDQTEDSFVINTEEDPTRQLQRLADRYDIYTQVASKGP